MGIVFRQSVKTSGVIFAGVLLGALFNYLAARVLPISEVGAARDLITKGAIIQLFFLMGTASMVHTFAQRYKTEDPKRAVLMAVSFLVPLVMVLLFTIPYLGLKQYVVSRYQLKDRPMIRSFYMFLPLLALLWSYMTLLEMYLSSRLKVAAAVFMREVVLRICNLALIGLFFWGKLSFYGYVLCTVLVHIVPVLFLLLLSLRTEGFAISFKWKTLSRKEYYEAGHYAWYHMLTGVSLYLLGFIDTLLLGPLSSSGFDDIAIYGYAQFLISILVVPYRAMAGAAVPRLNEAFLGGQTAQVHQLFNRAGINMLIVACGMWLIVICNLHNAVAILPAVYAPLAPVVLILSIGRMIDMATGLNTELISVASYYKFNFRLSLLLLVFILVFDRLAIPRYGIYGAAWVSSIALCLFNIVKMAFLYRKTGLQPFSKHSAAVLFASAVTYSANWIIPRLANAVGDALLRTAVLAGVFTMLLILLRPSPDLRDFLGQIRKNKRLF